jgi:MOSC domain-containing protein YiiM
VRDLRPPDLSCTSQAFALQLRAAAAACVLRIASDRIHAYCDFGTMKLLSVNVGVPREIEWKGKLVRTSIFKALVQGRLRVSKLNLDGDQQSDLSVHRGIDKAVYAYPSEHYSFWREELPGIDLPRGVFGENFTTEGLLKETVHIGDRFRVSSAEFVVTQPRMPCFKLGIRFDRPDIVKRFLQSGRTGFILPFLDRGRSPLATR